MRELRAASRPFHAGCPISSEAALGTTLADDARSKLGATVAGMRRLQSESTRRSRLRTADHSIRSDRRATLVARLVGAAFVPAGIVKFAAYGWELDNFRGFGLPFAAAWVVAAGVIEIAGGLLLLRRSAVVPSATLLAITMVIAIAVSGIAHGDIVPSLTIAPVLLAGLLYVLARALASPAL